MSAVYSKIRDMVNPVVRGKTSMTNIMVENAEDSSVVKYRVSGQTLIEANNLVAPTADSLAQYYRLPHDRIWVEIDTGPITRIAAIERMSVEDLRAFVTAEVPEDWLSPFMIMVGWAYDNKFFAFPAVMVGNEGSFEVFYKGNPVGEYDKALLENMESTGEWKPDVAMTEIVTRLSAMFIGMNVKGMVELEKDVPSAKLQAARAKRGKKPLQTVTTVSLFGDARYGGGASHTGSHGHKAPHLRRGHIKQLACGPRWWSPCAVNGGGKAKDIVVKNTER